MTEIKKAAMSDAADIMEIFKGAQRSLALLGVDQWQDGYPNMQVVKEDIERGISLLYLENGELTAVFSLLAEAEPTYKKIYDGSWLTDGEYVTIHRIAVSPKHRREHIATKIIEYAKAFAAENNKFSLRVDTHRENLPMRSMLEKNGFTYCGIIYLERAGERVAYELKLA